MATDFRSWEHITESPAPPAVGLEWSRRHICVSNIEPPAERAKASAQVKIGPSRSRTPSGDRSDFKSEASRSWAPSGDAAAGGRPADTRCQLVAGVPGTAFRRQVHSESFDESLGAPVFQCSNAGMLQEDTRSMEADLEEHLAMRVWQRVASKVEDCVDEAIWRWVSRGVPLPQAEGRADRVRRAQEPPRQSAPGDCDALFPSEAKASAPRWREQAWPSASAEKAHAEEWIVRVDLTDGSRLGLSADRADGRSLRVIGIQAGALRSWNCANPDLEVRLGDRIVAVNGHSGDAEELVRACRAQQGLKMVVVRPAGPVQPVPPLALPPPILTEKFKFPSETPSSRAERQSLLTVPSTSGWSQRSSNDGRHRCTTISSASDTESVKGAAAENLRPMTVVLRKQMPSSSLGLQLDTSDCEYLRVAAVGGGAAGDWNEEHPDQAMLPGDWILSVNGTRGNPREIVELMKSILTMELVLMRESSKRTSRSFW